jgi:CRP-like cAMP-binding protein
MANWLGWKSKGKKRREGEGEPYPIDDLIALGRFEEARTELLHRVRSNPRDHHSLVKLGDVYRAEGSVEKAGRTYLRAAESYAGDGFHEKALALMLRVQKELPQDRRIDGAVRRLQSVRQVESHRDTVIDSLSGAARAEEGLNRVVAQRLWPAIAASGLTSGLASPDVRRLFLAFEPRSEPSGVALAEQGSEREALYLVLQGAVEAETGASDRGTVVLETLGPSALFGERSLLEHHPWPATFRTRGRTTLLLLRPERLPEALQGSTNPRSLLDALRVQERDQEVHAAASRLLEGARA